MISVENLHATAGSFELKDISLHVPEGRILTILGPSGSGKTLLLRCVAGLHPVDSGAIFIGGREVSKLPPKERGVGFVFQNYALFPHLDSAMNLGFPLFIRGVKKRKVRFHAEREARELDGLPPYLDRYPRELPEGMKQLLAIGRERFHEFDVLLLDEPMSQLDAKVHVEMRGYIKRLVRELGKTTIAVFSDPDDAMAMGDLMAVMEDGRILQQGSVSEVYENPISLAVMELTSKLGVNRMDVEVREGRAIPVGLTTGVRDGEYVLAFRPDEIEFVDDGIPFEVLEEYFYDGRRALAECKTPFGNVHLLIPIGREHLRTFLPVKPKFFARQ